MSEYLSEDENGELYKVSVWVPTRGTVVVNEFWDFESALALALALEPLQVQIDHRDGHWCGGRYMFFEPGSQRPFRNLPARPTSEFVLDDTDYHPVHTGGNT